MRRMTQLDLLRSLGRYQLRGELKIAAIPGGWSLYFPHFDEFQDFLKTLVEWEAQHKCQLPLTTQSHYLTATDPRQIMPSSLFAKSQGLPLLMRFWLYVAALLGGK